MEVGSGPELVAALSCDIGEGPIWHPDMRNLLFLDISAGNIYAYSPQRREHRLFSQGPQTGGMTVQEDGRLLLFQDGHIAVCELDGVQHEVASGLCPKNERFNDVIADPEGRVFAGALGGNGRLLRLDTDGSVTELFDGIGIPNGMGFTLDCSGFYFTDSAERRIFLFDYDLKTGRLSNRRMFIEIAQQEGLPDGMAVDAEGFVWTAVWFAGRVKRYSPSGILDGEISFNVTQTSAIAFGGPSLGDIYVTTAASPAADSMMPPSYDRRSPRGGGLYAIQIAGLHGRPHFRSRINFKA